MAGAIRRIPFEEFSSSVRAFFELVISKHKAFMVEKESGEVVVVKPFKNVGKATTRRTSKTEADFEAFRSAAGSWGDVDTDAFIKKMYESRRNSSRPPVRL
jgi:hypothetical protein